MSPNPTRDDEVGRLNRERILVAAITILAAWPRFRGFGRAGLVHFDEGIYALAGLWAHSPLGLASLDPQLIAYAPPLFPILIGVAYSVLGVSDAAALIVPAILGVLTVPLAASVGRRTFGPGAGVATSAFAALSIAHVAFSRKALTDVPFLVAWLAAMGLGSRFLEKPSVLRAAAFGLAVGVAQNLKYNGWLGLVVVGLAALLGLCTGPDARKPRSVLRTFGLGLVAVLVAAVAYFPWYRFVEAHGGYAELVRHHRSYLGGLASWYPHWKAQLAQAVALSGNDLWVIFAWSLAWLGAGYAANGGAFTITATRWDTARFRVGGLIGVAAVVAVPNLAWWVGLAWVGWLAADSRPARRVLAAWWLVFSIMTPFYHPYARLWLPLHAAGWLLMAGVVVRFGPFVETSTATAVREALRGPKVRACVAFCLACLLASWLPWVQEPPRPLPDSFVFAPSDGFRTAAVSLAELADELPNKGEGLAVLARRPLAFYLATRGVGPIRLLPGRDEILSKPSTGWVLVDSVQFGSSLDEGSAGTVLARRWRPLVSWDLSFDAVTELDVDPDLAYETHLLEKPRLVLFAPRSSAGAAPVLTSPPPGRGPRP